MAREGATLNRSGTGILPVSRSTSHPETTMGKGNKTPKKNVKKPKQDKPKKK